MGLRFATPVANGLQPTVAPQHPGTHLRGQHHATVPQFRFPGVVDGDVVGILGIVIGAVEQRLIFGPGKQHQFLAAVAASPIPAASCSSTHSTTPRSRSTR
jgi:hypothetical protein